MRITVTLDKDVARFLRREVSRFGTLLKAAVNYFLRAVPGVSHAVHRKPFVAHPKPLGLPIGFGHESVEELLERLESITHK